MGDANATDLPTAADHATSILTLADLPDVTAPNIELVMKDLSLSEHDHEEGVFQDIMPPAE